MKKGAKRILAALLSLCMAVSTWTPAITAEAATKLVNVATSGTASTTDGEYDSYVITNVNDGDDTTSWQTEGTWPATAVVQLDMGRNISEVVVKLGGEENASRTVKVTVEYAQNGVTSDLIAFGSQTVTLSGDKKAEISLAAPVSATHIYVTLSEPMQNGETGAFWPCVSEIEIYEPQEEEAISAYNNIANQAAITATGNNESPTEGSANLVDGSTSTLYKFYNAAMTSEQSITLTYEQARAMDAVKIAFENAGTSDSIDFAFTYSILARNGDGEYDTIVANATANRTDNSSQEYKFLEKTYSEVKIVMHSCTTYGGTTAGWPAVAEFEVYGSEVIVEDDANIALGKSVHVSSGKTLAKNITDGSKNTAWRGSYYPAYADIDLGENYNLDTVEVFTPENGYSQYSIYTSMNGRDFEKLAEKTSRDSATLADGEVYTVADLDQDGREARIIRVYLEYNSAETAAVINEVRVTGTASGTAVQERPAIDVKDFDESEYADMTITAQDTYDEVYGIIERRLGVAYKDWFTLELAENSDETGYDYFELSTVDGKVHVKGNDGVSLATGINHFLKYYCNVNISQVGDQVTMPATIPAIDGTVHKETKAEVRYSYNYCTLSYSMAFWGEQEWRDELDWLALNGVNVVLDATAQEEVWRRFLGELGYSHEDAKDFIAGPAYYAWAYMANLSGFGGPVHDSWFEERTALARKNQEIMRKLGMQPVLQGYSGMVPTDIVENAKGDYAITSSDIIGQGNWCSFQRPAMLVTTSEVFDTYAELFYKCQKEVYGDTSDYYATDPFHEGGTTGGMSSTDIAEEVLTSMLAADTDAIWIIQAWQGNPTTALLNGLDEVTNGAQHALVLDLYAEKTPHYDETGSSYGDTDEFDDTPWVFCMLNNFGGRLGMHGHLDNLANNIPTAFNTCTFIKGIGITPEASVNNPVLYDFLFETIWQDDASKDMEAIDLDSWLDDYATRRYGAESESANQAWAILKETVYKSSLNNLGQGAPESVVNARPALSISAASTWGNAVISYDKLELEEAAELLLKDYDKLKGSEGYLYDVATVLQQVLSNSAQTYHGYMANAYNNGDVDAFTKYAATFMEIIDYMEQVTSTSEYYLLGRWTEQAKALAANADDFTKELYEMNARALVTTWGSYNQAENGGLKDYSNRQWSGLIKDFYKVRWNRWITARTSELKGESYESSINWFQWEWEWVRGNTTYTTTPSTADLSELGAEILETYSVDDGASDDSRDLDVSKMTVTAGTQETDQAVQSIEKAFDSDTSTKWHSEWDTSSWYGTESCENYLWVEFTFDEATLVDAIRYLPSNGNGDITGYRIEGQSADGTWTTLTTGTWERSGANWKIAEFDATEVVALRLVATSTYADSGNDRFASATELRVRTAETEETTTVDKTELIAAIAEVKALAEEGYTSESWAVLQTALTTAETVNNDADATAEEVAAALESLKTAKTALETNPADDSRDIPVEQYTLTAGTTQSGMSMGSATDGDTGTWWHTSWSPASSSEDLWFTLELNEATEIEAVRYFPRYQGTDYYNGQANGYISKYRVEVSMDGLTWETAAEGTWATSTADFSASWKIAEFDEPVTAKYVKLIGVETYTGGYVRTTDMSIAEIRVKATSEPVVDKTALAAAIATAEALSEGGYTADSWSTLQTALTAAKTVNENADATEEVVAKALADLQAAQEALRLVSYTEKTVTVKVGETITLLDLSGKYNEAGLADLDTTKATVTVAEKTINDQTGQLFNKNTSDSEAAITRYTGDKIALSGCLYYFEKIGEDTYCISGVTADGQKVYLNPNENTDAGYPNTITEEQILVKKVTDADGTTVKGFTFQDLNVNKTDADSYYLQFVDSWCVFNENPQNYSGNITKEFQLYEIAKDANGDYVYQKVTDIQDGGTYLIAAEFDTDNDDTTPDAKFVLRPSSSTESRNDHIAKVIDETTTSTGNEITITGVSAGVTSVIVGTTKYNINVTDEKDITLKVGETIRIFDQSGTYDASGLDTLNTSIAAVTVETKTINDKVAKLYDGATYNGSSIGLGDCIYTFNKNADGTYCIIAVTADGESVYLNPYTGDEQAVRGFPNTTDVESITVVATDAGFKFLDSSKKTDGTNYCLTFVNDWKVFNENPSKDPGGENVTTTTEFKLYELQESSDGTYTYQSVTEVRDGGQYVIVAEFSGEAYALHPSAATNSDTSGRNTHVAKVTDEITTITGNEILISGVSIGETSVTVGNIRYNINVLAEERYVKIIVGDSITVEGTSVTQEPDSQYVTMEKVDSEESYQITAVTPGETTAVIGDVIYHITVVETQIASAIGTSEGRQINRLTMSANNTFDLDVINSHEDVTEWKIVDKTGQVVTWATISEDGVISATNQADHVNTYEGYIVATVDGKELKTELKITPAPVATATRLFDVYINELYHTDVYYGWIYEYDDATTDTGKAYGYTGLTQVVEGEVIYVSIGSAYENALDFFAKPEKGYALTQMGSTGTAGHYMRLDGTKPEETEFIKTNGVAGYNQYHDIDAASTVALVQLAMEKGCHGAQGFTRYVGDAETFNSILNYRSEKLPTVEKSVRGVLGANGMADTYRPYAGGMAVTAGEYVYFDVMVTTYDSEDLITYSDVVLTDDLSGATFYEKDGTTNPTNSEGKSFKDITEQIAADGLVGATHIYNVVYQITDEDVEKALASDKHSLTNIVELDYIYSSAYSSGTYTGAAESEANILLTNSQLNDIVVDFGLPVVVEYITADKYYVATGENPLVTAYGEVSVAWEEYSSQGENSTTQGYRNVITYTPTKVIAGMDVVTLTDSTGNASVFYVYPATTVYYEEEFAEYGNGWVLNENSEGSGTQEAQSIAKVAAEDDADAASATIAQYGYDAKYAEESVGASNGTEAVSNAAGDLANFTFTGNGLDIYANCQGESTPTGTISILVRNADTNAIEKLMIVNTKIAGTDGGATAAQNNIGAAYSLPVASIGLGHGDHNVTISHSKTKAELDANKIYPVKLDGFRVYNTLTEQTVYAEHKETNPGFLELRNSVLGAIDLTEVLKTTNSDEVKSVYAEDIAAGLTQVYNSAEVGGAAATAFIVKNDTTDNIYKDSAKDLLDNGPKNEIFLYPGESLIFAPYGGLENVQLGLKTVNGTVAGLTVTKQTVTTPVAAEDGTTVESVTNKVNITTIPGTIKSSTDMFYKIGDIEASTESTTVATTITITNPSESAILCITDMKYFGGTLAAADVLRGLTEEDFIPALTSMGYKSVSDDYELPSIPLDPENPEVSNEQEIIRISGATRYETSYAVAEEYKEALGVDKFDAVIVATGTKFADALSGSYLSSVKNAPILLTNEKRVDELVAYVKANLAEDGTVYILGGTAAVPETVEAGLADYTVKRLAGTTRYETNLAILEEAGVTGREILIATGTSFADSLSASATKKPILLVKDEITDAHRAVLRQYDGGKIYIIGGTGAVSEEIQTALTGHGRIYRISGTTRYETSVEVAKTFFADATEAVLAYAKDFPDGLSGGPLAMAMDAPLILTAEGKTDAAAAYAQEMGIESGVVLGGDSRISDDSVRNIFGLSEDAEIILK